MLTLTPGAATAIKGFVQASGLPDEAGLRIHPESVTGSEGALGLALVEQPLDADVVIDEHDAHVFVDSDLSDYLDDKVLDATMTDDGVQFTIADRRPDADGSLN